MDGRFSIKGMRVGGPYTVTRAERFQPQTQTDSAQPLGVTMDVPARSARSRRGRGHRHRESDGIQLGPGRHGDHGDSRDAGAMPTLDGRLGSYVRLTPQSSGGMSFAGQDNRLNNITVDGSSFNNSFGLGGTPGDRTGVAPISVHAIEEVQVNIAPYDVRRASSSAPA